MILLYRTVLELVVRISQEYNCWNLNLSTLWLLIVFHLVYFEEFR